MAMGKGVRLNPENDRWVEVTRHEHALRDQQEMDKLGLRQELRGILAKIPHDDKWVNDVRLAAVRGGLIRLREDKHGNLHAQFYADYDDEIGALRSIYVNLKPMGYQNLWYVWLENLKDNAYKKISFEDFEDSIRKGHNPLRASLVGIGEDMEPTPITPIVNDRKTRQSIDELFQEYRQPRYQHLDDVEFRRQFSELIRRIDERLT